MGVVQRITETPNAVMTTLGSPTCGGTKGLSMWRVQMAAGVAGPVHVFDREQVWSLDEGALDVTVGDDVTRLHPGESILIPAGVLRQIRAACDARATVAGSADAVVAVPGESGDRGTPIWIA